MYVKSTAPRSIGGVLDDAIKLFRESFSRCWPLSLCYAVLAALPGIWLANKGNSFVGNPQAALAFVSSPLTWTAYLWMMCAGIFFYNTLIIAIHETASSRAAPLGQVLRASLRLLPRTIWLAILLMLVILGCGILAGSMGAAAGMIGQLASVVIIGAILFGLFYALGKLMLSGVVLVVEDEKAGRSMRISWSLVKHNWWRAATIYTVGIIMVFVVYLFVGLCDGLVLAFIGRGTGAMAAEGVPRVIAGTLVGSFIPAILLGLYYDLKLRKEGTDLADKVSALAAP
ncbi:MAG TPA: hypothetical protein VHV81_04655 [Steroidobacteraceae bacterium]|jgi:hypothetical protein|nr:hypothetical protein [Steroidobacteraceae bacterium]